MGGVLLTDAVDFGEIEVKEGVSNANAQFLQLTSAPSGGNSKTLLEVVLGLFGVTATGVSKNSSIDIAPAWQDWSCRGQTGEYHVLVKC